MKKRVLVILILLVAFKINAQQDPQYTQYMYNMNVINPAYAGSNDGVSFGFLYRGRLKVGPRLRDSRLLNPSCHGSCNLGPTL